MQRPMTIYWISSAITPRGIIYVEKTVIQQFASIIFVQALNGYRGFPFSYSVLRRPDVAGLSRWLFEKAQKVYRQCNFSTGLNSFLIKFLRRWLTPKMLNNN